MEQLELVTHRAPRDLEAAEIYTRVLVDSGQHARAAVELLRLATLYADVGRVRDALAAVELAGQLQPACLLRHRLAPLVFRLGPQGRVPCERAIEGHLAAARLEPARDLLALLVEAQPAVIELRHRLAKTELLLGRTRIAVRHLRIVLERYRDEQCIAQLVPVAEELLRHGGHDAKLLWELTLIYLQADLHERALEKLEQLQRLLPSDLEIVERVANLQSRLGRLHASLGTLWRLVREMRNAGADDVEVRALLERARNWNDARRHRESIDALMLKVLPRPSVAAEDGSPSCSSDAAEERVVVETPRLQFIDVG